MVAKAKRLERRQLGIGQGKYADHPWDRAAMQPLLRKSPNSAVMEELDPGVNFFVRAMEVMGVTTLYSCSGHPEGFYILFTCPAELARAFTPAGIFQVMVMPEADHWRLQMRTESNDMEEHIRQLREEADYWMRKFGDRIAAAVN